jgi:hypothetical protein
MKYVPSSSADEVWSDPMNPSWTALATELETKLVWAGKERKREEGTPKDHAVMCMLRMFKVCVCV